MSRNLFSQAASFALALAFTAAMLAGVNGLAAAPQADALFAQAAPAKVAVQQVVVVGHRAAHA